MDEELKKYLSTDTDGLKTYEYLANNINTSDEIIAALVQNMIRVDLTGQFTVSAARYLYAIDPKRYATVIDTLIAAAINKDREHKYIGDLLITMWGDDFEQHATEIASHDDNFRRIYKRLHPASAL